MVDGSGVTLYVGPGRKPGQAGPRGVRAGARKARAIVGCPRPTGLLRLAFLYAIGLAGLVAGVAFCQTARMHSVGDAGLLQPWSVPSSCRRTRSRGDFRSPLDLCVILKPAGQDIGRPSGCLEGTFRGSSGPFCFSGSPVTTHIVRQLNRPSRPGSAWQATAQRPSSQQIACRTMPLQAQLRGCFLGAVTAGDPLGLRLVGAGCFSMRPGSTSVGDGRETGSASAATAMATSHSEAAARCFGFFFKSFSVFGVDSLPKTRSLLSCGVCDLRGLG
jgi:hypothetical protein